MKKISGRNSRGESKLERDFSSIGQKSNGCKISLAGIVVKRAVWVGGSEWRGAFCGGGCRTRALLSKSFHYSRINVGAREHRWSSRGRRSFESEWPARYTT